MARELKQTSSAEVSVILRLLEAGNIDTLYRDLYLERAHARMGDLLPHSEYLRLKYSKVNIDDLLRQVAPVLERQDWLKVKLEQIVAPLFYRDRDGFIDTMRHAIALNGSFFNTHRMMLQYVLKAYLY